jgi:hypothetical protein
MLRLGLGFSEWESGIKGGEFLYVLGLEGLEML